MFFERLCVCVSDVMCVSLASAAGPKQMFSSVINHKLKERKKKVDRKRKRNTDREDRETVKRLFCFHTLLNNS